MPTEPNCTNHDPEMEGSTSSCFWRIEQYVSWLKSTIKVNIYGPNDFLYPESALASLCLGGVPHHQQGTTAMPLPRFSHIEPIKLRVELNCEKPARSAKIRLRMDLLTLSSDVGIQPMCLLHDYTIPTFTDSELPSKEMALEAPFVGTEKCRLRVHIHAVSIGNPSKKQYFWSEIYGFYRTASHPIIDNTLSQIDTTIGYGTNNSFRALNKMIEIDFEQEDDHIHAKLYPKGIAPEYYEKISDEYNRHRLIEDCGGGNHGRLPVNRENYLKIPIRRTRDSDNSSQGESDIMDPRQAEKADGLLEEINLCEGNFLYTLLRNQIAAKVAYEICVPHEDYPLHGAVFSFVKNVFGNRAQLTFRQIEFEEALYRESVKVIAYDSKSAYISEEPLHFNYFGLSKSKCKLTIQLEYRERMPENAVNWKFFIRVSPFYIVEKSTVEALRCINHRCRRWMKSSMARCLKCQIRLQLLEWKDAIWSTPNNVKRQSSREDRKSAKRLNPEQREILRMLEDTQQPISLVWGPPGTGKTSALALALALAVQARTVRKAIVLAPTNSATDALASKILAEFYKLSMDVPVLRIYATLYNEDDIPHDLRSIKFIWDRSKFERTVTTSIVVCTLGTAALRLEPLFEKVNHFDVVLLDEAGRVNISETFPVLALAKRAIICGDHRQLRPYVPKHFAFLRHMHWDVSILEFLMDLGHPHVQLVLNYRSVQDILHPSNDAIYSPRPLRAAMDQRRREEALYYMKYFPFLKNYFTKGNPGLAIVNVRGHADRMFGGTSIANVAEAYYVVAFIIEAFYSGLVKASCQQRHLGNAPRSASHRSTTVVGVVSFYKDQQRLIELMLEEFGKTHSDFTTDWLRVLSAEKFQGLEASWVLITGSQGHADIWRKRRTLGFVGDYERINVAITRGRLGVIAFMSSLAYNDNPFWRSFIERAQLTNGSSRVATDVPLL